MRAAALSGGFYCNYYTNREDMLYCPAGFFILKYWEASANAAGNEKCKEGEHLVNNKHVIELCRSSWFVRSFFNREMKTKELDNLIEECARAKVLIREGRHYRRWDKFRITVSQPRHRIDGRKNPPLKKTKAGFTTCNH